MEVQRIALVGRPGSGKTTLARQLARRYQLHHIEVDRLFWGKNWTACPMTLFCDKVTKAVSGDSWVIDNYFVEIREIVWQRATMIIWLDYPLWLCAWRFLRRTWQDYFQQSKIWGGNQLCMRALYAGKPPLLWWMWHTYHTRPRNYSKIFTQPDYAHVQLIRLSSAREIKNLSTHLNL